MHINRLKFKGIWLLLLICTKVWGDEPLVLDLTTAVTTALNSNRQLLGTLDQVTYAQYGVELAESEFNVQLIPNGRAGFVGGAHAGTGWSVGGGVDVNKKFKTGTQLSIGPTILKTVDHYHTEVRAKVTQPLLRGLGSDYQLSNVLGAKFAMRTAYRNLYIAQVQLIVRTIQALYDIVKAEKILLLDEESYQRISRFYHAAKLKEKIGLSDALDIYRAEIELRHAEDALTGARERLHEAEDLLRDLLALPLDIPIQVDVPVQVTTNQVQLDDAIQLAFDHRMEIEQSEDESDESRRMSKIGKKT